MTVLERYVYLAEKDSSGVSTGWRGLQVFIYATIFISGMIASLSIGKAISAFGGNCYIFGNVTLTEPTAAGGKIPIDNLKTEWGKEYVCDYCLYVPICGVLFSVVWSTFFVMCGRGGRTNVGIPQPWRVTCPALIFSVIFFFASLPASISVEMGSNYFCDAFIHNNNKSDCSNLVNYTLFEDFSGYTVYQCFTVSMVSSWIHTAGWFFATVLLLIRCCTFADFELVQVTVSKYNPTRVKVPKENLAPSTSDSDA